METEDIALAFTDGNIEVHVSGAENNKDDEDSIIYQEIKKFKLGNYRHGACIVHSKIKQIDTRLVIITLLK